MRGITDLRVLWAIGAVMIIFCSVGVIAAAAAFALPFYIGAVLFDASRETVISFFFYAAVLWAPIGFGAGVGASSALVRGIRRKPDSTDA